jgi:hypothetical protein
MKQTNPDHRNRILLRDYHNYSFCRTTKRLFRSNFGGNIPIKKDDSGRFRIKKNAKPYLFTEDELMKLTDYAGRCGLVSKGKGKV